MKCIDKRKVRFELWIQGILCIMFSFAAMFFTSILIYNILGNLIGGAICCYVQAKYYKDYIVIRNSNSLKYMEILNILGWIIGYVGLFYMMRFRLQFLNNLPHVYVNRRVEVVWNFGILFEALIVSLIGRVTGNAMGIAEFKKYYYRE